MSERFDELFEDSTYLHLKNSLFSYQLRQRHLRPLLAIAPNERTLDLGCGISPIAPSGPGVVYVDISFQAMRHLSRQHAEASFVVADVSKLPFRSNAVFQVVCSEVLEHVEHDQRTLLEMGRVLRPGGQLLVSVPLHPYYYSFDDRYVGHYRRYVLDDLIAALEASGLAGFRVRKVAGVLEKAATYVMARSFALLSRSGPAEGSRRERGERFWFLPYKIGNSIWSYICWMESKIVPLRLTTIASVQCRKPLPASGDGRASQSLR